MGPERMSAKASLVEGERRESEGKWQRASTDQKRTTRLTIGTLRIHFNAGKPEQPVVVPPQTSLPIFNRVRITVVWVTTELHRRLKQDTWC